MPEAAINLWALDKDSAIKHLLLLLRQDMGSDAFELVDTDQLNHQSIRLGTRHTPATVYIYTYGQRKDRYGLHLEYPRFEESNVSELEEIYEDLNYDKLLEILKLHLQ